MKEQAYNIIKTKDSRTQRQSNLNKSKEARFKISPHEFEDHTLGKIVSLKYVCEHGSSESAGYLHKEPRFALQLSPITHPFLRQYTRRARIAQSSALPPVADESASPIGDDSQGEACPTVAGLVAGHDRANITKTSTLPSDSTPRVTSLVADEGSIAQSGDDAPIKGRSLDEGKEAAKKGSDDTEEMVTVITSLDASIVLSSGVAEVPTGSGSIPTVGPSATGVPTGSDVVPTASPIFTTATESTPYTRRKGK
nr:hypothetical protein [Tanacetum cinerariifolium]